VTTDAGVFRSDALVIASGGPSYPDLGASGFGLDVARQFGLLSYRPGRRWCPLSSRHGTRRCSRARRDLPRRPRFPAGQSVSGERPVHAPGPERPGSAPGVAVLDARRTARDRSLPGTDILEILTAKRRSRMELRNLLSGQFPKRFAEAWCDRW